MCHSRRIAFAGLVCLWMVCAVADAQAPAVASPAESPASKVPTQLPEGDCSALTQNYYRQMSDLLSRMMGTTSSIQALNFQIQALRAQLQALQAEQAQLAAGVTKGDKYRASQIAVQMESLTAQIEGIQDQIGDLMDKQGAIQEAVQRVNAEYAAKRKALRCA